MLERLDGKLSRAVLRGEWGRKAPDLPGELQEKLHPHLQTKVASSGFRMTRKRQTDGGAKKA